MKNERDFKAINGFPMLLLLLALIGISIYGFLNLSAGYPGVLLTIQSILIMILVPGFLLIYPNNAAVITFFGKYSGTIKQNGFKWLIPLYRSKKISLRAENFDSERIVVNDKRGNPILISVIAVWRVKDTYKAAFDVSEYHSFVKVQSDAAVRQLAGSYSYDNLGESDDEITLRSDTGEVSDALEKELSNRLSIAGIEVIEARIGYLAYAPEIAGAMLKRQQAEAIVAARFKIVEGAVGMVELALKKLSEHGGIELDEERKAAMVCNLMIVLCADKEVSPVINTGTLHN